MNASTEHVAEQTAHVWLGFAGPRRRSRGRCGRRTAGAGAGRV